MSVSNLVVSVCVLLIALKFQNGWSTLFGAAMLASVSAAASPPSVASLASVRPEAGRPRLLLSVLLLLLLLLSVSCAYSSAPTPTPTLPSAPTPTLLLLLSHSSPSSSWRCHRAHPSLQSIGMPLPHTRR